MNHSKTRTRAAGIALLVFAAAAYFVYDELASRGMRESPSLSGGRRPCPGPEQEIIASDDALAGLVARGQKLKLITDWYLCHQPERGELVYYRFSSQSAPVARVVRAASGDAFHVSRDEQRGAWNLTVNGELLLGPDGTPYFFGAGPASMLAVYEKSNGGRLAEGDLIVLSNVPPGSFDSGIFGVVSRADLVGRLHPVSD